MASEKTRVTIVSLIAAVLLTAGKLIVAVASGSVAILADALHSGIDLIAVTVTFFAVRFASIPPDDDHPYGHQKAENLAAAFEALLLLITAGAVSVESIRRLLAEETAVTVTAWTLLVPAVGIVVDVWRSRMLRRAARRYRSQALEASALNFETDAATSLAVLIGLILVRTTGWSAADAVVALLVAGVVIWLALRLGRQAIRVLLDAAPDDLGGKIRRASTKVDGVLSVEEVRLREAGGRVFADLTVTVSRTESLARAHRITESIEHALDELHEEIDVTIHVEPEGHEDESAADQVRAVVREIGVDTHDEHVHRIGDDLHASLHLELDPSLTLEDAHRRARTVEKRIQRSIPSITSVEVHLEPTSVAVSHRVEQKRDSRMGDHLRLLAEEIEGVRCHAVYVYHVMDDDLSLWDAYIECRLDPLAPLSRVHVLTEQIERSVRNHYPLMRQVTVRALPEQRN